MEILGRIRAVLEGIDLSGREERIFAVMANCVLGRLGEKWTASDSFNDHEEPERWAYHQLAQAGMMWVRGRVCPKCGQRHTGLIEKKMNSTRRTAEVEVRRADPEPAKVLCCHWLLTLGEKLGAPPTDADLMRWLWQAGVAMQENKPAATFHRLTSETLLDGFVYDELVAIHAAYNSAKLLADNEKLERVRRAVRWHVENTQPDNTTNEPWALAAFAALDETGTFADQQLHDTVAWLQNGPPLPHGKLPVAVGLLADAVMTLENR